MNERKSRLPRIWSARHCEDCTKFLGLRSIPYSLSNAESSTMYSVLDDPKHPELINVKLSPIDTHTEYGVLRK